jgi:phage terminase Nu1 subunit (DNA packaging protein)
MQLLDTRKAAEFLGISVRTMEGYRRRGCGPSFVRLAGGRKARPRYSMDNLRAYLSDRAFSTTEQDARPDGGGGQAATTGQGGASR